MHDLSSDVHSSGTLLTTNIPAAEEDSGSTNRYGSPSFQTSKVTSIQQDSFETYFGYMRDFSLDELNSIVLVYEECWKYFGSFVWQFHGSSRSIRHANGYTNSTLCMTASRWWFGIDENPAHFLPNFSLYDVCKEEELWWSKRSDDISHSHHVWTPQNYKLRLEQSRNFLFTNFLQSLITKGTPSSQDWPTIKNELVDDLSQ